MEISAQSVIDRLTSRIAALTRDLAVAEAQIETLNRMISDNPAGHVNDSGSNESPLVEDDPLVGEVIE